MTLQIFGAAKPYVAADTSLSDLMGGIRQGMAMGNDWQNQRQARKEHQMQMKKMQEELQNMPKLNELRNEKLRTDISNAQNHQDLLNSPMGKAIHDRALAEQRGDMQAVRSLDQYINKLGQSRQGFSMMTNPNGGVTITQGGLVTQPMQGGAQQALGQQSSSPQGMPQQAGASQALGGGGNIIRPMTSGGTSRSNEGGTLQDQNTGNAVTIGTNSLLTQAQKSLSADYNLGPNLIDYIKSTVPYVGSQGQFLLYKDKALSPLNIPNKKYENYMAAQEGMRKLNTETISQAGNFPRTEGAIKMIQDALTPRILDNQYSFIRRGSKVLAQQALKTYINQNTILKGLPLQSREKFLSKLRQYLEDMYDKRFIQEAGLPLPKYYQNQPLQQDPRTTDGQAQPQQKQRTMMISPEGKKVMVLNSQVQEALKPENGFKMVS